MVNLNYNIVAQDIDQSISCYAYKSYIKLAIGGGLTVNPPKNKPSPVSNNIRNGFGAFLKDFGPTLIVKILKNIISTGSFFEAIQRSMLQVGQESVIIPNSNFSTQTQIFTLLNYTRAYLDVTYQQNIDDMEEIIASQKNGTLATKIKIMGKKNMIQKIKGILNMIDYLEKVKSQIENYLVGKTPDQIITEASNTTEKPVGVWAQIVNWVKNKFGRGNKSYSIKAQLDQFIQGLLSFYHISGISSILLGTIAGSSIMNRYNPNPVPVDISKVASSLQEINQSFNSIQADTIDSNSYIALKTTINRLSGFYNVYASALKDNLDNNFKIAEIRAIYALMINTLRDIISQCMKISPDPIIYNI